MDISGSKPQMAQGRSGSRALKANKSCVPCRVRKIKCDANTIDLPCSNCISRQCVENCVLTVRKGRSRKTTHVSTAPSNAQSTLSSATSHSSQVDSLNQFDQSKQPKQFEHSIQTSTSGPLNRQSPHQPEPDLLYLKILNDTVTGIPEPSRLHTTSSTILNHPRPEDSFSPRKIQWSRLPQLDDMSNDFLVKMGVFDLPPPRYLDALIKIYFDCVYPFTPAIDRADFIRGYQNGRCSLFLLRVILTLASTHAPADVLSGCGFTSPSAAQESFFSKAKLIHNFAAEDDPLVMLQGSIILCSVILDHPSDRDFSYWFYNAIRLATMVDLRNMCVREDKPLHILRLYRRIWWTLYSLDIFHVFLNPRHSRLLEDTSTTKFRTEDDWDSEDVAGSFSGLLSPVTPQQKALPVVHSELSRIFGKCLAPMTSKPQQDPRQMMHPLEAWRKSLATKMHVDGNTGSDVYYLNAQAMSYRFECILCRLIRRLWKQSQHADWSEWATQRFRSAILELDTIAMRVLATGTLQDFPIYFLTTMTTLLALHIETALDPDETDLVHSMARISISHTMLLLSQGKDIPALKRALPLFKEILTKKSLYSVPPDVFDHTPTQSQSQSHDTSGAGAFASPQPQVGIGPAYSEQVESGRSLYGDFLGIDLLDDWSLENWSSFVDVDIGLE